MGGTDAFCHIVLLYSFSRLACDSFVKVYNFKLKFIFATSATFPCKMEKRRSSILLEWRYLCMRSLLRTSRCKRVKLKLGVFYCIATVKRNVYSALLCSESVLVYELFLSDCCFFYLWRFSLALRERSFFISPYLCYSSYLLHLNANRTKMRTIFKGKHFKNGKIELGGGAGPTRQKFLFNCHFGEFVCRKRIFIFIYTFRISHVQNIEMWKCPLSIANVSEINLIFTISEGRRLEERKAILRSYFSFILS